MRINELPLYSPGGCVHVKDKKKIYRFPIVLLHYPNGMFTWRGVGQKIPDNMIMIGVGDMVFAGDDDSHGDWLLEINPVGVEIDFSKCCWPLLGHTWWDSFCEDHDCECSNDGHTRFTGAKYKKKHKK